MGTPFFTIGHSDRSVDDFIALLEGAGVELVVDVRKLPGSKRHPQFNQDTLALSLEEHGIGYRRSSGLTGRRLVSKTVPGETNAWWQNRSFHNYADHALGDEFGEALAELREAGRGQRLAVMCSEAVWWRCHRRIIADHLIANGEEVFHIMGEGRVEPASLSPGAEISEDLSVRYPPEKEKGTPDE